MESARRKNAGEWEILDYEIWMFRALRNRKLPVEMAGRPEWQYLRNALTEAIVLHTRILVEILLSRGGRPDDIQLKRLLPSFASDHLLRLKTEYGTRSEKNSPCWRFNKLLAHATTERSTCHDYSDAIRQLDPIIEQILAEVASVRPIP